ncbi:MAG: hypothetical protein GY859_02770 [Desulfobacterales bacterium]|nr:hypothetical protein [Desulfobacterales bacterium]
MEKSWGQWILRLLVGIVGMVLLISGLLKAMDMELFIRQIKDYGMITHPVLLTLNAWGVIIAEWALGAALVVGYRLRLTVSMSTLLMLVFLGAVIWAWLTGSAEDCGCFGAFVQRTPAEAAVEDVILLAILLLGIPRKKDSRASRTGARVWVVLLACLMGATLPLVFGSPIERLTTPPAEIVQSEFSQLKIQGVGMEGVDLNRGTHLIILMETDCLHCQEAVVELNALAETFSGLYMAAVCVNDESQREEFIQEFQPIYKIGQITEDDFWRLLGDGDIPRVFLLSEGRVLKAWDVEIPDEEMIQAAFDH